MSTRKSSQASGWPSAVGSIQPSPKLRFEADLLDRDAAECSACGLPQTQMPNPDAVTSTLYSLHAGVFSSGVVKLDGGDGGGGALSLPGVRGAVYMVSACAAAPGGYCVANKRDVRNPARAR